MHLKCIILKLSAHTSIFAWPTKDKWQWHNNVQIIYVYIYKKVKKENISIDKPQNSNTQYKNRGICKVCVPMV